jgi:1,4-alpha-glucan branching enzyme
VEPGSLVIVLHAHLPYGLGHNLMEEHWLYEAAAETYVPLLQMARRLELDGIAPNFAISFTPVLLEQLADERFKRGFREHLDTLIGLAESERKLRLRQGEKTLALAQQLWLDHYSEALAYFCDSIDQDLPAAFGRLAQHGGLELLTSAATHGYLPLIGLDANVRAQIEIGVRTYRRHFKAAPRGFWLPECGFRPAGRWQPPLESAPMDAQERRGVDDFLRDFGIDYFFIDQPQLKMSPPGFDANSPLRLHRMLSQPLNRRPLGAYTRDFDVTRRVWQAEGGYPGDFFYLEFHKKTEEGKFRLWRVSGAEVDLADKRPYLPERAAERVAAHAEDFVTVVRDALRRNREASGEAGLVVASFDAELFGHWWFEGVAWLEQVARLIERAPDVRCETPSRYFDGHPPNWHVQLKESSWGRDNDHSVWLNEEGLWTWRNLYQAETTMQRLGQLLNGRELTPELADLLRQTMRELLLLEGSDWSFMISNWSTRDHAEWRASCHFNDFRRLALIVERAALGDPLGAEDWEFIRQTIERDALFGEIDLDLFWPGRFHVSEAATIAASPSGEPPAPLRQA